MEEKTYYEGTLTILDTELILNDKLVLLKERITFRAVLHYRQHDNGKKKMQIEEQMWKDLPYKLPKTLKHKYDYKKIPYKSEPITYRI